MALERTNQFGDLYTNGINYYMVISDLGEQRCECGALVSPSDIRLRSVVVDDNKIPTHFVGYDEFSVSEIKPYARLVKHANYKNG